MNKEHSHKDPAISVCMPMYNASLHLWECIDSILGQSFGNFELLIADDGSTDSSVRIVQSYDDPRIRLFRLEHDYIHTCNYLLHQARGKYIARMDADDVMCPDRLQIEFDYMEEHPEVDIVGGRLNYIGQPPTAGDGKPVEVTAMMLRRGSVLAHPTVMLRRERLMACRLEYQREYIYAEDYNLWADAVIAGLRIVDLPEVLVNYRFSENQVTYKYNKEQAANARKVQLKLLRHLDAARNKEDERCPEVAEPLPGNRLTLIIPFLNEGSEVRNTLHSIRECAADRVEVIVINDASDDGIDYASEVRPFRVSYLVNKHRKGVAGCRDWGISLCRTPFFLLLDAHMRFYDGRWPERLVSLLEADDRVLLCCQTRFLEKDGEGVVRLCEECATTYGAVTPFEQNQYWPDIKWNYRERCPG